MLNKTITVKGRIAKAFPDLIKQVMEASRDGWEPKDAFEFVDDCRMYSTNWFAVKLTKEEELEEETKSEAPEETPDVPSEKASQTSDEETAETPADSTVEPEVVTEEPEFVIAEDTTTGEAIEVMVEEAADIIVDGKQIMLERIEAAKTKKDLMLLSQSFEIEVPKNAGVQKLKKMLREGVEAKT